MTTSVSAPTIGSESLARSGDLSHEYVPATPRRRSSFFWGGIVVGLAILSLAAWSLVALGTSGDAVPVNQHVVGMRTFKVVLHEKGELKAAKSTDIKSKVEGRATIISLIAEGKAVEEGELLVELASDQIEDRIQQEELKETNAITAYESAKTELDIQLDKNASDVRKGQLEIELNQLELDKYLKGEWPQKLKDAKFRQLGLNQFEFFLLAFQVAFLLVFLRGRVFPDTIGLLVGLFRIRLPLSLCCDMRVGLQYFLGQFGFFQVPFRLVEVEFVLFVFGRTRSRPA